MELHLSGQVAIVTGGASGIGLACATELAREGCSISLWDLSTKVLDVALELKDQFRVPAVGFAVDVCQFTNIQTAVEQTEQELGPIEVVVHSAAVSSGRFGFPFTHLTPSDWNRGLDVNILGMVNVAHAVGPGLMSRRRGSMVFISSIAGQIGSQTDPPYSASKAANINFAQCLAKDMAPQGVRVNTVCPGMVQTPLNRSVWQAWNDQQLPEQRRSYEEWADAKIRNVIPLGRWQRAEDIANLVTFLSSDRASEITGQTMNVDGGCVMHW